MAAALVAGLLSASGAQPATAKVAASPAPAAQPPSVVPVAVTEVKAVVPKISGTLAVGSTLTAARGSWAAHTTFTYQWYASGVAIKGATKSHLKLAKAQVGRWIRVTVTGMTADGQTETRTSAPTAKVLQAGTPKVSGSVKVGSTVQASPGSWTSSVKLSYQWLRRGAKIPGATKTSYQVKPADADHKLSVKVTGKRVGYATVSMDSAGATVKRATLKTAVPVILGMPAVGQTLTAQPGTWTKGTKLSYQWFADGAAVKRGKSSKLRPGYLEAGRVLTVAVTGTKPGYRTVTRTSAAMPTNSTFAVYEVGVDIPEGIMASAGGENCGWFRLRQVDRTTGAFNPADQLGFRWISRGPALAALHASDPWFMSIGCSRWAPVEPQGAPATSFGDGDYLVNLQVQPGAYMSEHVTAICSVHTASGAGGDLTNELIKHSMPMNGETMLRVQVPSSAFQISSSNCGHWTRVGDS